ncbi:MAG: hypothetical protein IJ025_08165 [Clostridia bacterium]|nr:hypothetical protein [Clostridia bacterium]
MNKCTSAELEKIEKRLTCLRNIWPNITVNNIVLLSKYQVLCLGALLQKPVVPGIKPVMNLSDANVKTALKSLQTKQIYFPRFSGVGEVDENISYMIEMLCRPGEKCQIIFNHRAGRVNEFFISFSEKTTILVFELSEGLYVFCHCDGVFENKKIYSAGEITAEQVKGLKEQINRSLDASDVKKKLQALNDDTLFVDGMYDCLCGKANSGMFCKYHFDGINFNSFESGFVVCGKGSGGTVKLRG